MFCPKCGCQLPDGAKFCQKCGFNLSTQLGSQSANEKPTVVSSKKEDNDSVHNELNEISVSDSFSLHPGEKIILPAEDFSLFSDCSLVDDDDYEEESESKIILTNKALYYTDEDCEEYTRVPLGAISQVLLKNEKRNLDSFLQPKVSKLYIIYTSGKIDRIEGKTKEISVWNEAFQDCLDKKDNAPVSKESKVVSNNDNVVVSKETHEQPVEVVEQPKIEPQPVQTITSVTTETKQSNNQVNNKTVSSAKTNTAKPSGSPKNKWVSFALCFFLGFLGAHKFYEGKIALGVVYLLTAGLFYIGWFVDLILILLKPTTYYVNN